MNSTTLTPAAAKPSLANTVSFGCTNVSFLLTGQETGGSLSVMTAAIRPGGEPPYHVHMLEDEIFYVLEGHLSIMVDGQVHECPVGSTMFLPRGLPHTFRVRSEVARTLIAVTPSGFEKYFQLIGTPATSLEPSPLGTLPPEYFEAAGRAGDRCGVYLAETQPQF